MEASLNQAMDIIMSRRLWGAVLTMGLGLLSWLMLKKLLTKSFGLLRKVGREIRDPETVLNAFKYLLILVFGGELLDLFGVDLSSLATGLGIAGVVVGFAVQDLLKDITMGANILADGYFSVGDIVSLENVKLGRVVSFSIKTTRVEDLETGSIVVVANRNISRVTHLSDWQDLDIPAPYEEKPERMREICERIRTRVEKCEDVSGCEYLGTSEFADSAVYYRLRITGAKDRRKPIRRAALGIVQDVYEEEGISVPYPHMEILERRQ